MKILLITQVLPYPPASGPKAKTYNLLKYLAQGHEVTLVSFLRADEKCGLEYLEKLCHAVYTVPLDRKPLSDVLAVARSLVSGQPWIIERDDRREMRTLVDRLARQEQFDIVQADQLNMAQFAERVPGARKVLDAHNALWLLYKRLADTMGSGPRKWLLERDWPLIQTVEGRICREFDAVAAVSQEDKAALVEAGGDPRKITVIPIAVDADELQPVERQPDSSHLLHIGTMFWPPNIDGVLWFIREVLPLIRRSRPDAVFDVVGARPPEEIRRLGGEGSGINVAGFVEDTLPYLQQAAVMVVPLRAGGGMRVKILNSLAQAMPVVTTTIGCEGIAVQDGCHLLVADTPDDFARAVLAVLDDRALARQLGQNGRQLVLEKYDYHQALRAYETVYGQGQAVEKVLR